MGDCQIPVNPDVGGIGVRLSIYITSLLVVIVPRADIERYQFSKLRARLEQAAGLNGTALLITTVIQSNLGQLDAYHAIVALHLLVLLGVGTISFDLDRHRKARFLIYCVTMLVLLGIFTAWWLYVWITIPSFGVANFASGNPMCNHTVKLVVLFANVRLTAPWLRWMFVANGVVSAIGLIVLAGMTLGVIRGDHQDSKVHELPPRPNHDPFSILRYLYDLREARPMLDISRAFFTIYGIVMLELIVARNDIARGENVWSFGQVLAMLVTLSGIKEVVEFFL
ncbi:hypothetical protein DL93DRAFT_2055894 [Clavulina sp. PMI_390]|nr:hypothetical protein DL93DRAFT_2055894 [Clavulina sp. PMI_390]